MKFLIIGMLKKKSRLNVIVYCMQKAHFKHFIEFTYAHEQVSLLILKLFLNFVSQHTIKFTVYVAKYLYKVIVEKFHYYSLAFLNNIKFFFFYKTIFF